MSFCSNIIDCRLPCDPLNPNPVSWASFLWIDHCIVGNAAFKYSYSINHFVEIMFWCYKTEGRLRHSYCMVLHVRIFVWSIEDIIKLGKWTSRTIPSENSLFLKTGPIHPRYENLTLQDSDNLVQQGRDVREIRYVQEIRFFDLPLKAQLKHRIFVMWNLMHAAKNVHVSIKFDMKWYLHHKPFLIVKTEGVRHLCNTTWFKHVIFVFNLSIFGHTVVRGFFTWSVTELPHFEKRSF